ncbi:hypothetical protein B4U80_14081 [Leptotrombidium deliense]|uniref:C2H2-type domain-containing protein n=1 Tax=Leptotrombidium deliense TaxID=299467 RepID=A0A443S363_9ACAR|nr:hypothetical protein B4U80_14081 [Leptotrombidium deliense]
MTLLRNQLPTKTLKVVQLAHRPHRPSDFSNCHKQLSSVNSVLRHMTTVHQKAKLFGCNHCGKRYAQPKNLKVHKCVSFRQNTESFSASDGEENIDTFASTTDLAEVGSVYCFNDVEFIDDIPALTYSVKVETGQKNSSSENGNENSAIKQFQSLLKCNLIASHISLTKLQLKSESYTLTLLENAKIRCEDVAKTLVGKCEQGETLINSIIDAAKRNVKVKVAVNRDKK